MGTVNFRYGKIFLDQYKEATIFTASLVINCINEFDLSPGASYSSIRVSNVGDSLIDHDLEGCIGLIKSHKPVFPP